MVVAVFTDAIGSAAFNQAQAQTRASAVTAYLESHGVAAHRLIARGVGEAQPINTDNTPEGRSLNRRIELTISDSQAKS